MFIWWVDRKEKWKTWYLWIQKLKTRPNVRISTTRVENNSKIFNKLCFVSYFFLFDDIFKRYMTNPCSNSKWIELKIVSLCWFIQENEIWFAFANIQAHRRREQKTVVVEIWKIWNLISHDPKENHCASSSAWKKNMHKSEILLASFQTFFQSLFPQKRTEASSAQWMMKLWDFGKILQREFSYHPRYSSELSVISLTL